jgi:hypothetical protein
LYPEVRSGSLNHIAQPDLLAGDESGQSYSVRLAFTIVSVGDPFVLFLHATRRFGLAADRIW